MIDNLVSFINEIYKYPLTYIKDNNIKTNIRESKITIEDTLYYRFKYIFEDASNTFQSITSSINHDNLCNNTSNKSFTRSAISKKEKLLPYELYKNMFMKIKDFYYSNYNECCSIIVIDGIYSNTNFNHNGIIETCMNLGIYDNTNGIPIDIYFTEECKKNNECIVLKEYIMNNLDKFKNKLIICDRAYYNYSFFNFLNENNIKYIIRLRDKATTVIPTKYSKHYNDYNIVINNKNNRIITKIFETDKKAIDENNNKYTIKKNIIVKLITNLNNEYNDDKIHELYKSRWNIEEFFKLFKHNFKFQYLKEYNKECYNKNIYCELIITILKQILIKCYEKINNKQNKCIDSKKKDSSIKIKKTINENLLFDGIKNKLLKHIIYKTLTTKIIDAYLKSYIIINYNRIDRHNERKSKRPFTKWYVKKYHDVYKLKQKLLKDLINYHLDRNENTIVSNLKIQLKELNKERKILKNKIKIVSSNDNNT